MNTNRTGIRGPLTAVAVVVALALLMLGSRAIAGQLDGAGESAVAPAAQTGPAGAEAPGQPADGSGSTGSTADRGPDGQPPGAGESGGQPAPPPGEPVAGVMTAGKVIADEPFAFTPAPDRVTVTPGPAAAARAIPQLPAPGPAPRGGSNPGGSAPGTGGTGEPPAGTLDGSANDTADRPIDGTVDLALGVRVETTGHLANIFIGVGGGLSGGLAALRVDFGDGRTRQFTATEVATLRPAGSIGIVHTYQPTLTPESQRVLVTATDGAGEVHQRSAGFQTRAAFRLSYSALTVTSTTKCDSFDINGDFELTWRLDSRPARVSSFKRPRGIPYVEEGFRVAVEPVSFGEAPEYFEVTIDEKDPPGAGALAFWRYGFGGSFATDVFFDRGPVAQLGDHHYDVTMRAYAGSWYDCQVRMVFTAYLTMIDSLDRR
jgi:hypothetical protein